MPERQSLVDEVSVGMLMKYPVAAGFGSESQTGIADIAARRGLSANARQSGIAPGKATPGVVVR